MDFSITLIISLIVVIVLIFYVSFTFIINTDKHHKNEGGNIKGNHNNQVSGENNTSYNNVGVVNNFLNPGNAEKEDNPTIHVSPEDIKANMNILFVDDKDDFFNH